MSDRLSYMSEWPCGADSPQGTLFKVDMLFRISLNMYDMKECVITVKKVYETKKSRTVTERSVVLGEEELGELCVLVCEHVYSTEGTLLHGLFEALREV